MNQSTLLYYVYKYKSYIYDICSEVDVDCEIDGDYENEATTPIGGFVVNKKGFTFIPK